MKIILGTANVAKKYGLNSNNLKIKEFDKAKKYLKKNNFFLEVAEDYRNIKYTINNKLKLFYKINFFKNKNNFTKLQKLSKKKNIFCLMVHSVQSVKLKEFNELYEYMFFLKSQKLIKSIGISIYDLKDLNIIKKYNFDYIQVPLNLFNQTFNKKNTQNLRKRGTKFIARSVLFQGLIFNDNYIKLKNITLNNKIKIIKENLYKKEINFIKFFLNFIKLNSWLWGFVIGVDNLHQLKQIKNITNQKKFIHKYQKYKINEKKIIDARNW